MHVLRRNVDVNILLFNNQIYGLTKGQYSPTSEVGTKAPSTPYGSIDYPVNPIALALGAGATFIARVSDTDAKLFPEILTRAHQHKGTSFVEVLQNCPVFNDGIWGITEGRSGRRPSCWSSTASRCCSARPGPRHPGRPTSPPRWSVSDGPNRCRSATSGPRRANSPPPRCATAVPASSRCRWACSGRAQAQLRRAVGGAGGHDHRGQATGKLLYSGMTWKSAPTA
jgi:hypothetical protein